MTYQLTYSDREFLLQTFDTLKSEWHGEDEQLLADACDWAKSLEPICGFEHSLSRDITALSRYLTSHKANRVLSDIARGGLLYVLRANQHAPSKLRELGLLDDAFITSFAVHEIRVRIDDQAIYNPPRLTREEQRHAENLFLALAEKPILNDQYLIDKSRTVCDGLGSLVACGLFQRLKRNVEFLISVISKPDWSQDQRCYARAALSYLICEEDAIDDHLGIVGYLDDNFIAQMAVDLIEPKRDPWAEILDTTVGAWPFLNSMVIDDGSGSRPLSEYMIINSALSCTDVRGEHNSLTALVVPYVGPTPLVLGFVASLGLVQNSGKCEITEESFIQGQKVLVDNNAIAVFAGIKEFDGHRMFGLTQYYRQQGFDSPGTRYWPIHMLRRLVPIDPSRSTRGKLNYDLSKSEALLPALEYLFNASKPADLAAVTKKVIVVTPLAVAGDLAKRLRFHNFSLKEVVPMGSIVDDKVNPWSNRFGLQEPMLLFTPDVDVACAYAEEYSESIDTVIVDMTGRNSGKLASLGELQRMDFQTLVIIPERSASELRVEDDDSTIMWEWDTRDLSGLLWPQDKKVDANGIIVRYEHRLQAQSSFVPQTKCIDCPLTDEVFESVRSLKSVAQERGEDSLAELDELVVLAFGVTSRMFRSATLLTENIPSYLAIENSIKRIRDIASESRYLSEIEQTSTANTRELLHDLFEKLKMNNPKAVAVQEILETQSGQTIICPDRRLLADLEQVYGKQGLRILNDYNFDDEGNTGGAIIPGWFRKDRMARLLVPPVTQPLTLLLYDPEYRWHADFCHERKNFRIKRSRCCKRSKVFPSVRGWSNHDSETEQLATDQRGPKFLRELESIQDRIHAARRKHAYQTAKSDGSETEVPARLVLFEGGAHAFLRKSYKAIVVTHLLEAIFENREKESVDVTHKIVKELKSNDALLFHRRSDRNVIRMAADEDMPEGLRETAMMWQKALVNYVQKENLNLQEVQRRLRKAGCPVHIQTIRGWLEDKDRIAPRQYERDIGIIAMVTGDQYLNNNLESVLDSVSAVFGAHQRASHKLASQVLHRAIRILREERRHSELIELESDIVLARITEIDEYDTNVRLSMVNSLQESEQWHI